MVLVITGGRYSRPDQSNISVGIPFFASAGEALILFKDYNNGRLFVIDAKGAFEGLMQRNSDSPTDWESLSSFANEAEFNKRCGELDVCLAPNDARSTTKAVSLGSDWDNATGNALVNVRSLLEQVHIRMEDLRNILGEEAITQLSLLCKTRGQLGVLRDLLLRHKQQEVIVRLEDRHRAGTIMEKLQSNLLKPEDKDQLMEDLRSAHSANRATYLQMKNSPSEESRLASDTNRLINRGLEIIARLEKSSYTADILNRKSNRAMRSEVVSAADAEIHCAALDLSDEINAFRSTCSICCGEEQIMSVVLKRLDTVEENTTDFALNFPLAAAQAKQNANMISSQCICFQCALLCPKSIYNEDVIATIPTVDYHGANKRYINHQLTLAITAGLATGASGIIQLFMTILDRTLEIKNWCSEDNAGDPEIQARREVLDWTLQNLLRRCRCRKTFSETGDWVDYPEALLWAFMEYETAGLDSWIIQYPLAGFSQLLRWSEILDLGVASDKSETIKRAKLIHLTTTAMMNGLLHEKDRDKSWTHPFLHLIYQKFNAPGIPRDLGPESVLDSDTFWTKLEDALGHWQDVKRFLTFFEGPAHANAREGMASRIQLVVFWALFTQKGHTTPKTFFTNIKYREPLAPAALDPTAILKPDTVNKVLKSIFCHKVQLKRSKQALRDAHMGPSMPPFVSPFGASVLRCGMPGCDVEFYSQDDMDKGAEAAGTFSHESVCATSICTGYLPQRCLSFKIFSRVVSLTLEELLCTLLQIYLFKPPLGVMLTLKRRAGHGIRARRAAHFNNVYGDPRTFHNETGLPDPTSAPKAPTSYHNTLHVSIARAWSRLDLDRKKAVFAANSANESETSDAVAAFVEDVRLEVCVGSRRGNIYSATLDGEVRTVMPSLLEALRVASVKGGAKDASGLGYVFDWTENTIVGKMKYELSLLEE